MVDFDVKIRYHKQFKDFKLAMKRGLEGRLMKKSDFLWFEKKNFLLSWPSTDQPTFGKFGSARYPAGIGFWFAKAEGRIDFKTC